MEKSETIEKRFYFSEALLFETKYLALFQEKITKKLNKEFHFKTVTPKISAFSS